MILHNPNDHFQCQYWTNTLPKIIPNEKNESNKLISPALLCGAVVRLFKKLWMMNKFRWLSFMECRFLLAWSQVCFFSYFRYGSFSFAFFLFYNAQTQSLQSVLLYRLRSLLNFFLYFMRFFLHYFALLLKQFSLFPSNNDFCCCLYHNQIYLFLFFFDKLSFISFVALISFVLLPK